MAPRPPATSVRLQFNNLQSTLHDNHGLRLALSSYSVRAQGLRLMYGARKLGDSLHRNSRDQDSKARYSSDCAQFQPDSEHGAADVSCVGLLITASSAR